MVTSGLLSTHIVLSLFNSFFELIGNDGAKFLRCVPFNTFTRLITHQFANAFSFHHGFQSRQNGHFQTLLQALTANIYDWIQPAIESAPTINLYQHFEDAILKVMDIPAPGNAYQLVHLPALITHTPSKLMTCILQCSGL